MSLNRAVSPDDPKKRSSSRVRRGLKALTSSSSQSIVSKPKTESCRTLQAASQTGSHYKKGFVVNFMAYAGLDPSSVYDLDYARRLFHRRNETLTPESLLELNGNYSRASSRHMYQFYEEQDSFKQSIGQQKLALHNTSDRCIDYGASGRVYTTTISIRGELDTLATKIILRADLSKRRFDQPSEFDIMKGLRHNHIVAFVNAFGSPFQDQDEVGVQMYPVAICNLGHYLRDASWLNQVTSYNQSPASHRWKILLKALGCLSSAVRYLHKDCTIKHKDIKPENILINKYGSVLLADFGISKKYKIDTLTDGLTLYTDKYAPPEVAGAYGRELDADIYSLGCVYLEIVTVACGQTLDDLSLWLFGNLERHRYRDCLPRVKKWIARLKKRVARNTLSNTGKDGSDHQQTLSSQHLNMILLMMSSQRKHRPPIDEVESCFSQFAVECPECQHNDVHNASKLVSQTSPIASPKRETSPSLDLLSSPCEPADNRLPSHSVISGRRIQPTTEFYRMFEQAIHMYLDRTFGEGIQSRPWSQYQGRGRQSTPPSGPNPKRQALGNANHGGFSDEDGHEKGNSDREPSGQAPAPLSSSSSGAPRRLACLYLKHSPQGPYWPASCRTPFPDFTRVREHMFRVHLRQNVRYSCDRCQTSFDSREELRAHMRLDEPCPLRPHADDSLSSEVRVLDQAQYDSLPYRQRSIGDAEKWIRSYRILFRPTNDSQIPSPFFGDSSYIPNVRNVPQSSQLVLSVEDMLHLIQANPQIVASAVASWPGHAMNQDGRMQLNGLSSLPDASQLFPQLAQRSFIGQLPTPQHTTSGINPTPSLESDYVDFNAAGNATNSQYASMSEPSTFFDGTDGHQAMAGDQNFLGLATDPGYAFDDNLQPAPLGSTFDLDNIAAWANIEDEALRDGMNYSEQ